MDKKYLKTALNIVIYIFAAIGLFLVAGYFAVKFGFTNQKGIIDVQRESFLGQNPTQIDAPIPNVSWKQSEQWTVLSAALAKDQTPLSKASTDSGVSARLIAANLVTEQLRLFFTERETYKQFFAPLKILGSQTQFSWGVMGLKEDTAVQVENNLKDPDSPFYPGNQYAHLLDFPASSTVSVSQQRYTRMTDQHNHYWSYLYAGLYIKEIEAQWRTAGFPIDNNVAVLSTLYNIGFVHSMPNVNPQVGGAAITAGNQTYSFGGLAKDFYDSNLLTDIFPK